MIRLLLPLVLWAGLALPAWLHLPAGVERWLFNPRERTERGIAAFEKGDFELSARNLDAASRLAPEDPLVRFDAGTAKLAAGADGAAADLEKALTLARPELLPAAAYNLGNSKLADDDPAAAVEAYKKALRADPYHLDAKFNLELALRRLQEQQSGRNQDQESPEAENSGEEEQSQSRGEDSPADQDSAPEEKQSEPRKDPSQDPQGKPDPQPDSQSSPLPNFDDQPQMSAEQAAAILEAVENLEREQRRLEAERRSGQTATDGRDW